MNKHDISSDANLDNNIHASYEYLLSLIAEDLFFVRSSLANSGTTFDVYKSLILDKAENSKSIFFYSFDDDANIERKPEIIKWDAIEYRLNTYQKILGELSRFIKLPGFCFGIEYEDMGKGSDIPLLCFHKHINDLSYILVPDFEITEYNYYTQLKDGSDFNNKIDKAVFVGSTTGTNFEENRGCCNTLDNILSDPSIRIAAAAFFNNNENVVFKLPSIVQCDSAETEEYLRKQPYTQSERMTWDDQYQYRYIISIDGNGPTCTRVALSLLSNSVLMKYNSNWIVYYHRKLKPFYNFLPVRKHDDVERLMDCYRNDQDFLDFINNNAKREFRLLFNRVNVQRMFAIALNEFYAIFFGHNDVYLENRLRLSQVVHFDIDAHFSNIGDRQFWPNQDIYCENQFIEGITIYPASGLIDWDKMEYQAKLNNGALTASVNGGGFAGTKNQSLCFTAFRFIGEPNSPSRIEYSGEFQSGMKKTVSNGEWLEYNNEKLKRITLKVLANLNEQMGSGLAS